MPRYDYTTNIPDGGQNPSDTQQPMQTNCNSINSIWNEDHYTFNDTNNNSGLHKQITLPIRNAGATQSGTSVVVYTAAGIANTASSQLLMKNSIGAGLAVGTYLSAVKAWGTFNGGDGSIYNSQISNATVSKTGTGVYAITLTANAVSADGTIANYGANVSCSRNGTNPMVCNYNISTSPAQFEVYTFGMTGTPPNVNFVPVNPTYVSFVIYQI